MSIKNNFQISWKLLFLMQHIVYFAVTIKLSDEYLVLNSYKMSSFKYNFPQTTSDTQVNFLHFFSLEGLSWRTLTKQFFY